MIITLELINPNVRLTTVSVGFVCTVCGNTWGTRLLKDYTIPLGADKCMECAKKDNHRTVLYDNVKST
jgi:hypothetical protein